MKSAKEYGHFHALNEHEIDSVGDQVVGGYDHDTFAIYAGASGGFITLVISALAYWCPRQTQAQQNPALNNVMGNHNRPQVYQIFLGASQALTTSWRQFFGTLAADVDPNNGDSDSASFHTAMQDIEQGSPAS
jgi:hypothetical protein